MLQSRTDLLGLLAVLLFLVSVVAAKAASANSRHEGMSSASEAAAATQKIMAHSAPSVPHHDNDSHPSHLLRRRRRRRRRELSHDCSNEAESCRDSDDCCDDLRCFKFDDDNRICTRYAVSSDTLNGPRPTESNTDMKFLAFGDTPYDDSADYPLEGEEFDCLKEVILPGVKRLSEKNEVDWIVHVGDIMPGDHSSDCDDTVSESRKRLFESVEPDLDFLLLPGDNEFSDECEEWTSDESDNDPVQKRWREHFTKGDFRALDKDDPEWGKPRFRRQEDYPENFCMYYEDLELIFFGITEPDGDDDYNAHNADYIKTELRRLDSEPNAIVIFGHSKLETSGSRDHILEVLEDYSDIPMLYVMGNDHKYDMDFMAPSRLPKLMQLTVKAYTGAPLLVSVVDYDGDKYFHVEKTDYSCDD
jgi:hypothetical protein